MESFYRPAPGQDDAFDAHELTRGPWSKDHQHAGPPSALLVRAAEGLLPQMRVGRFTCEMLRPIPLARVRVAAQVTKPGRKAAIVSAQLFADDDAAKPCIDARVLMVRSEDAGVRLTHLYDVGAPDACAPYVFRFFAWPVGYHTAVELRTARGAWGQGDVAMWMRPRVPLVEGELASGAQLVAVCADAGSGVTLGLDVRTHTFLNADLTVHLAEAPRGEWFLLDGQTWVGADGVGMAETRIADVADQDGATHVRVIGRGVQTLVVDRRVG